MIATFEEYFLSKWLIIHIYIQFWFYLVMEGVFSDSQPIRALKGLLLQTTHQSQDPYPSASRGRGRTRLAWRVRSGKIPHLVRWLGFFNCRHKDANMEGTTSSDSRHSNLSTFLCWHKLLPTFLFFRSLLSGWANPYNSSSILWMVIIMFYKNPRTPPFSLTGPKQPRSSPPGSPLVTGLPVSRAPPRRFLNHRGSLASIRGAERASPALLN